MTRLGQMLMDEGMEKGIELTQTASIKNLWKIWDGRLTRQ